MKSDLNFPGKRYIAVIGDVHGCFDSFKNLFEKIKKYDCNVYCVGDIIDRGTKSKQTIQFCIDNNIKSVIGNHEHWCLNALKQYADIANLRKWLLFGGDRTVDSYFAVDDNITFKDFRDEIISQGHYEYLSGLPLKYEINNVIISHAGIIENGDDNSIFYNFEKPKKIEGKLQIFGHVPYKEVQYIKEWYASIDTGCVYKNKLTAIIVDTIKAEITDVLDCKYI